MKELLSTVIEVEKDDMKFQFLMPFDPNLRQLGAASDALYDMYLVVKKSIAKRDGLLDEDKNKEKDVKSKEG